MTTQEYGAWLAEQDWHYDDLDIHAWLLTHDSKYIAEGVTEDEEGKLLPHAEMQECLKLTAHAPRMLRFILRGLEVVEEKGTTPTLKLELLRLLLLEIAGNVLGEKKWRGVANAVEHQQVSHFVDED